MSVRKEYPRPELKRKLWRNLNGKWDFIYNFERSLEELISDEKTFEKSGKIIVPFCPESKLSGVYVKGEIVKNCLYRKKFHFAPLKGRTILRFEAVNYECCVFLNGQKVGGHKGGYTPFGLDITAFLKKGENELLVYCRSDVADKTQPSGKQSDRLENYSVLYTRATGIWQTVWLETVPETYLKNVFVSARLDGNVSFSLETEGIAKEVEIIVLDGKKPVASKRMNTTATQVKTELFLDSPRTWSPETPYLYRVLYRVFGENGAVDESEGYFGVRETETRKGDFLLNGKKIFQRLVLDQGYYLDGVYTAKTDGVLKRDILLAKKFGYNGARLHQKVFERRYLYHADRLGFYVWGEFPSWGFDHSMENAEQYFLPEWEEAVLRDYNHPSLICWCPMNENWEQEGRRQNDSFVARVYDRTKELDSTRPCIDVSWNYHVKTDVYDVHDYTSDEREFEKKFLLFENGVYDSFSQPYEGQPYLLSEYGGIRWKNEKDAFGYGDDPKDVEEFARRYVKFSSVLHANEKICGLCYTQLYDVEQEQNGLYFFNRKCKFKKKYVKLFREEMLREAAYERINNKE